MNDILGTALLDYINDNYSEDIITESTISEADEMPIAYLFRDYDEMPEIEQKALQLAKGTVLDIGCGAGSHSLYLQNQKELHVKSIDISKGAIETCIKRGLKNAHLLNFIDEKGTYDTVLLLMNGLGLCGTMDQLTLFLQHLKSLLNPEGQILLDSSDIAYMFDKDEDGGFWVNSDAYYGEIQFTMSYKKMTSPPFNWLYLDYNTLQNACNANGLSCELILEGNHFDYLAKLTLSK